jgi:hypothetical protein
MGINRLLMALLIMLSSYTYAADRPTLGPGADEGGPSHTLGLFDAALFGYVNYEMIADQSWAGMGLADGLFGAGVLLSPWSFPLKTGSGWPGFLEGLGRAVLSAYPIYGVANGSMTNDEAKKNRGWGGCALLLLLGMHSQYANHQDLAGWELGILPLAKGGGLATGTCRF